MSRPGGVKEFVTGHTGGVSSFRRSISKDLDDIIALNWQVSEPLFLLALQAFVAP